MQMNVSTAVELGMKIFPVHNPDSSNPHGCSCAKPDECHPAKHPRIRQWEQTATADKAQIAAWLNQWPQTNWATAPWPSGRLVVLDVDPRHGGQETLAQLIGRELTLDTLTVSTGGGGQHLYYRAPEGVTIRSSAGKLGPGLDVRAEGGYVLIPPSKHIGGGEYRWGKLCPITPLPDWLADELCRSCRKSDVGNPTRPTTTIVPLRSAGRDFPIPYGEKLTGADLLELLHDRDVVERVSERLRIPPRVALGVPFCCVLPGHAEGHPSATLIRAERGHVIYKDHHSDGEVFSLASVYASQIGSKVRHVGDRELGLWTARILIDSGVLAPAPVELLPLPEGVSQRAQVVYDAFRGLAEARWLINSWGSSFPFSRSFVADWTGTISAATAQRGITELREAGVIVRVGKVTSAGGRTAGLYLPGETEEGRMEVV